MPVIDRKFLKKPLNYIFQCFLAILTMAGILLFLDVITNTALIASLGATVFTVFTMPDTYYARARTLFGGYFIGAASGVFS